MPRLKLESLTDQVRHLLQRDIEEGKLAPGARIREDALARELGISKTPLRLAIHQLKQDGIIHIAPRRGVFVKLPTVKEVMELLEMREALAARRLAWGADETIVCRLRDCFAGIDERALDRRCIKYATADHRFHQTLVEACGSAELIQTLRIINVRIHMNRLRRTAVHHHDMRPIHREHLAIIDAIEDGDGERAAHLASAHVRGVPWQSILDASDAVISEPDTTAGAEA
jgi:DNA-binding GntR family transcriptional regulator